MCNFLLFLQVLTVISQLPIKLIVICSRFSVGKLKKQKEKDDIIIHRNTYSNNYKPFLNKLKKIYHFRTYWNFYSINMNFK